MQSFLLAFPHPSSEHFPRIEAKLHALVKEDLRFSELLQADARGTYTEARGKDFLDRDLFVEKAVIDIIDQCACLLVLAELGFRFQFYPGASYLSTEYVNRTLLPFEKQIEWVHVFLSIQSKSHTPNHPEPINGQKEWRVEA